jgi:hypothetical protein
MLEILCWEVKLLENHVGKGYSDRLYPLLLNETDLNLFYYKLHRLEFHLKYIAYKENQIRAYVSKYPLGNVIIIRSIKNGCQ